MGLTSGQDGPNSAVLINFLLQAKMQEDAKAATPVLLKCFENILKANNGGKGFFVGDKVRRVK